MGTLLRALFPAIRRPLLTRRGCSATRPTDSHQPLANRRILNYRTASTAGGGEDDDSTGVSRELIFDVKMKYKERSNAIVLAITPETAMADLVGTYKVKWEQLACKTVQIWSTASNSNDGYLRLRYNEKGGRVDTRGYFDAVDTHWTLHSAKSIKTKDSPSTYDRGTRSNDDDDYYGPYDKSRFFIGLSGINVSDEYQDYIFVLKTNKGRLEVEKKKMIDGWLKDLGKEYIFHTVYHNLKNAYTILQETEEKHMYISSRGSGDVRLMTLERKNRFAMPATFSNPEVLFYFVTSDIAPADI